MFAVLHGVLIGKSWDFTCTAHFFAIDCRLALEETALHSQPLSPSQAIHSKADLSPEEGSNKVQRDCEEGAQNECPEGLAKLHLASTGIYKCIHLLKQYQTYFLVFLLPHPFLCKIHLICKTIESRMSESCWTQWEGIYSYM